jgi:hypothetical protein
MRIVVTESPERTQKSALDSPASLGMASSASGAPKGGAFSPAGQDSLQRTKACTRPNTPAMPLKPEWSPLRAKRSLHKAKKPSLNETLFSIAKDKILNNA